MDPKATLVDSAVDRYFATGAITELDPVSLAKAIDDRMRREAQQSLRNAVKLAKRLVTLSSGKPSPLPLTAYRILARMYHMSVRHAEAEQAYREARALAHSDPMILGRIDRALVDVYMYLGDLAEARRRAQSALKIFARLKATADIAMTQVNYANLLHRQDKHRDAGVIYEKAEKYFQSMGDELSVARCQYNRANTLVQLFDFAQAEPLYRSSYEIYRRRACDLDATDARYGLAWLAMLRGQFHVALTELAECEAAFKKFGQPKGAALCELDRAEVYLGLNLLPDAYEAAKNAEAQFRKLAHRYEQAKAALFRGKAAHGLGKRSESAAALKRAVQGFEAEKNDGFLGASYLLGAQAAHEARSRAQMLTSARGCFTRAQLPLWQAVCDLFAVQEKRLAQKAFDRLAANAAVREVPHLFATWQTMLGDAAYAEGAQRKAVRHWQAAADRLDTVRAQLPPLELRSRFAASITSPHIRLIESEMGSDVERASAWLERYKTAGLWAPMSSLRPTHDQRERAERSLMELATSVAALSHQIGRVAGERGGLTPEAHKQMARLQRQVRLEMASAERGTRGVVESIEEIKETLRAVSHDLPVVQFHFSQDDIIAFVHQNGSARIVRFADGRPFLQDAMRQWRFILETELLSNHLSRSNSLQAEKQFFTTMAERLWIPLELGVDNSNVLLIPEGDLANLPWHALIDNGRSLVETHRFTFSPSLRHYVRARGVTVTSKNIQLFEGAAQDIPMVQQELQGLAKRSPDTSLVHRGATRSDWPSTGEAWIWHYSGHAQLRPDNPFYSSLQLVDGPMFAADFRLREVRVGLVTLAACRSGQQVALPGEESTGLVRSMLEMGARNVIAGNWPVSDQSTASWMNRFYEQYLSGRPLLESARDAALAVREDFPSAYHWAAFAVHGAGE